MENDNWKHISEVLRKMIEELNKSLKDKSTNGI